MTTDTKHAEAYSLGAEASKTALAGSTTPIWMMDEAGNNEQANSFAMGWNSGWASEENSRRWATHRDENKGA